MSSEAYDLDPEIEPPLYPPPLSFVSSLQLAGDPKETVVARVWPSHSLEPGSWFSSHHAPMKQPPEGPVAPSSQVFCRTAEESSGTTYCPVFRSSLRGALYLGDMEAWGPEVRGQEECPTMWPQWQVGQRLRETRGRGAKELEDL